MEGLSFRDCNITDTSSLSTYNLPNLQTLNLERNNIGREGCIILSNMLQKDCSTLTSLSLRSTGMGDDEALIFANSLKHNTKLESLQLQDNPIKERGEGELLKLVNDISSIENTYNCNHNLTIGITSDNVAWVDLVLINFDLMMAETPDPALVLAARRAKVIHTQLSSKNRKNLCQLQGVEYSPSSIFADIEPVLLPNILALIGGAHDQSELYIALLPSAPDLVSLIDKKAMLEEVIAQNMADITALDAEREKLVTKGADLNKRLLLVSGTGGDQSNLMERNDSKKRQRS